ncbi:hypothetical protein OPT61_g7988 [Boeremia exigua]|uniref:Uncharacterized protein n=1 Tax=Boeremia exigua TaxID=749465 RepID=A0ACC2I0D3_9PLEO|nr:hypothetical protein OPT61_g7988 [Boeremia exigua]
MVVNDQVYLWIQNAKSMAATGPTRLLDLDAFPSSKDICMVECGNSMAPEYATLSYRWGGYNPVTLCQENYNQLRTRIQFNHLPRTIREAVEVCRALSMRYLWVDALCIIQDGGADFLQEVANMGSIYAGSKFTIAAEDSHDCESGLFRKRSPLHRQDCWVECEDVRWIFQSAHYTCLDHGFQVQSTRLSERGWVFQERALSPRTVHFTSEEIIWECRERLFCHLCVEPQLIHDHLGNVSDGKAFAQYQALPWSSSVPGIYGKTLILSLLVSRPGGLGRTLFQTGWTTLLDHYSKTRFTNNNDRLSALAGVSQLIQSKFGYMASYGLWLNVFLDQLRWFTMSAINEERADTYKRLPSWSWLSTSRSVTAATDVIHITVLQVAKILQYPCVTGFPPLSNLLEQFPQPASIKLHGFVRSCQLLPTISRNGSCHWNLARISEELSESAAASVQSIWDAHLLRDKTSGTHAEHSKALSKHIANAQYYPDVQSCSRKTLYCLQLKRVFCTEENTIEVSGLVLERINRGREMYRRVAYFEEFAKDYRQPTSTPQTAVKSSLAGQDRLIPAECTFQMALTNDSADSSTSAKFDTDPLKGDKREREDLEFKDSPGLRPQAYWMAQMSKFVLFNGSEKEMEIEIV